LRRSGIERGINVGFTGTESNLLFFAASNDIYEANVLQKMQSAKPVEKKVIISGCVDPANHLGWPLQVIQLYLPSQQLQLPHVFEKLLPKSKSTMSHCSV